MVDVSVIIVSFNTRKLTLECIKSVIGSTKELSYEIIIVDNASSDGTVDLLQNLRPKVQNDKSALKIITNKKNLGFSQANNQGIRVAKGKYVLLLNSDTRVKGGAIEKLVYFAEETPDAGVVGSKLLNTDGSVQASVFRFPTIARAISQYWLGNKGVLDKYVPSLKKPVSVDAVVGAAFLITPIALKEVGLLDERYFMFYEDLDYCRRVWKEGLRVYYLPSSEIFHYHGASGRKVKDVPNQWRRLIPSSIIYHGWFTHHVFNFVLWTGQKLKKDFS